MPPALPSGSDQESLVDEPTKEGTGDVPMKDEAEVEDDEEDDDEDEEDTYIVEKILDHRSDFEDGALRFWVKWKGYEKKSDRTWETEENLQGAKEMLDTYWREIKKQDGEEKPIKKRGRQSNASQKATSDVKPSKRQRQSQGGRKSNGAPPQDTDVGSLIGFADVGEDNWKPPAAKAGSWDDLVQSIDTVVREGADGELWAYLIWNEKNDKGRFYRSKAKLPAVYKACPQRMLLFYERHLVFSTGNSEDTGKDAALS